MAASDHLSKGQFRFVSKQREGQKIVELHGRGGRSLAYADLDHSDDHTYINYLKSHEEGQGHARRLMEHVYDTHRGPVDWGYTLSPASTHLADSFQKSPKYGKRTYHDGPNQDE